MLATPFPYLFNSDQGITEATFEADLNCRGHKIHRNMELMDCIYTHSDDVGAAQQATNYPLQAFLKNHGSGAIESWEAKYLLGADGARSATRRIAKVATESRPHAIAASSSETVWAVADVLLTTDFPDYRRRAVIKSRAGGCMLIPRKDSGLRVFVQLDAADVAMLDACSGGDDNGGATRDESFQLLNVIQSRAQKVLAPFRFDITDVLWVSRYAVKQRLVDHFHDRRGRILLMGDACHTHSPKAGQGMNVSISDAYNLTWKLALVLKGLARPVLLDTYCRERKLIAKQLVEFDTTFAKSFGDNIISPETAMKSHDLWRTNQGFTSGLEYQYPESLAVSVAACNMINKLATCPLIPGKRILGISLTRHMDGRAVNLLDEMPASDRFHLFVLCGSATTSPALLKLAHALTAPTSPTYRFNSAPPHTLTPFQQQDIHSTSLPEAANAKYAVDVFLVHTLPHLDHDHRDFPAAFVSTWASRIYEDVGGKGHAIFGVDPEAGALALVRPDGYVGLVTALEALEDVVAFLGDILIEGQWFKDRD